MTHIENIPHVLEHGITHRNSPNHNPNFVPIGDSRLINKRTEWPMPNQQRLGDYTPFYFGPRMPMLYTIQRGYSGVHSVSPEKIVYCVTSIGDIKACSSVDFIFTDGHAIEGFSSFFTADSLPDIGQLLDWGAIKSKYWTDDNDPTSDLKRRKQAEFLLMGDLPISAIRGYIVYDEPAKTILVRLGINPERVLVKPDFYF